MKSQKTDHTTAVQTAVHEFQYFVEDFFVFNNHGVHSLESGKVYQYKSPKVNGKKLAGKE